MRETDKISNFYNGIKCRDLALLFSCFSLHIMNSRISLSIHCRKVMGIDNFSLEIDVPFACLIDVHALSCWIVHKSALWKWVHGKSPTFAHFRRFIRINCVEAVWIEFCWLSSLIGISYFRILWKPTPFLGYSVYWTAYSWNFMQFFRIIDLIEIEIEFLSINITRNLILTIR